MDCVWDRGSLVALPENLRDRHVLIKKIFDYIEIFVYMNCFHL